LLQEAKKGAEEEEEESSVTKELTNEEKMEL